MSNMVMIIHHHDKSECELRFANESHNENNHKKDENSSPWTFTADMETYCLVQNKNMGEEAGTSALFLIPSS